MTSHDRLVARYEKAEKELIDIIAKKTAKGNATAYYQSLLRQIQAMLKKLKRDTPALVQNVVRDGYRFGLSQSRADNSPVFSILDERQVALLEMNMQAELLRGVNLVGRHVSDALRAAALEATAQKITTGQTIRDVNKRLIAALTGATDNALVHMDDGRIGVRYRNGKVVALSKYTAMVSRTTTAEAATRADLQRGEEWDFDLAICTTHSPTCPVCAMYAGRVYATTQEAANGKYYGLKFPYLYDTALNRGYQVIHPNCLVPGGAVLAEGVMAHTSRDYNGTVIGLVTSTGNDITVTPNHPILTLHGFVNAASLREGDKIIEAAGGYANLVGQAPNDINIPTAVEQIPKTLIKAVSCSTCSVEGSAVQFHGDGVPNSKVDIVLADSLRGNEVDVLRRKPVGKKLFPTAKFRWGTLLAESPTLQIFKRSNLSLDRCVCCGSFMSSVEAVPVKPKQLSDIRRRFAVKLRNFGKRESLFTKFNELLKLLRVRFDVSRSHMKKRNAFRPLGKPVIAQCGSRSAVGYAKMLRNLALTEPLAAERLKRLFGDDALVVSSLSQKSTSLYSGKVYNLETKYGFYTYNNIVTHNCKHSFTSVSGYAYTQEELTEMSRRSMQPFKDNRTDEERRAYAAGQAKNRARRADEVKYEQVRAILPDQAPKSFGAFRSMKRANSERYQDLMKDYRYVLQEIQENDTFRSTGEAFIRITQETINSVPVPAISFLADEENALLQTRLKDLLRFVQAEPPGIEAAAAYSLDAKRELFRELGTEGEIRIMTWPNEDVVFAHNHPNGLLFSLEDIESFLTNGKIQAMLAVGNDGGLYSIEKTDSINYRGLADAFGAAQATINDTSLPASQRLAAMETFLQGCNGMGLKYAHKR